MIRKITCLLFAAGMVFMLNSCSLGGGRRVSLSNEYKHVDARMEQIMAAVKDKDGEALKALFSEKALGEAEDIDIGVDYLFNLTKGDIVSWERHGLGSREDIAYGKITQKIQVWYIVSTEEDKYLFFVIDFAEDTINPENEGMYTLWALSEEDEKNSILLGRIWRRLRVSTSPGKPFPPSRQVNLLNAGQLSPPGSGCFGGLSVYVCGRTRIAARRTIR